VKRALLLCTVVLAAAGAGVVSIGRARNQLAVIDACEAARAGDTTRALALTEGRTGASATGRAAAECRCNALLAQGDADACVALLEPLADSGEWTPEPPLAALLIEHRRAGGDPAGAAALARAAGRDHPADASLFRLELETRSAIEPEADVLRELEERVPERGENAARMRVALGQRHLLRGDAPGALRVLGEALPEGAEAVRSLWFDTVGIAHAMDDDLPATRATYARWEAAGGRPEEVRARYALALSVSHLRDPERDTLAALRAARVDAEAIGDAKLEQAIAIRLIFTLVSSGRAEEALALFDALSPRLDLAGVSRDELERARVGDTLARDPSSVPAGRLRFTLAPRAAGATLWLSPDAGAEPDADYEPHAIAPGAAVEVTRTAGTAPQRWVLRDAQGAALASGTVTPRPGETREIAIRVAGREDRRGTVAPSAGSAERAAGDGRRRVAMVLLDCGDWHLAQYLRTRGELPTLDALLRSGYRAVLDSDPPLTAAALEALVWPERRTDVSLLGTFYRFGVEMSGLESIGENPFELLSWVLPETPSLFSQVGAGRRVAANLLLAHGGVRAGRHGEVTGPDGAVRRLALGSTVRELDSAERARFPELAAAQGTDAHYVQTIAAEFDATEQVLREGEVDLLAVRIEPLDILTHAHFADAVRDGQDDGRGLLFDTYRYADARIAALRPLLDADDVLIVLSDHGIRTAMEHDRPALFVATGAGVPSGRAPGRPALRGVSRVVAELLGVETDWPRTGVAPWAHAFAEAPPGS